MADKVVWQSAVAPSCDRLTDNKGPHITCPLKAGMEVKGVFGWRENSHQRGPEFT